MIPVQIQVTDGKVLAALAALALEQDDKSALLGQIGANEAENTRLRFSDQHGPDGQAWVPSIRAKAQGGETLRDTGRLMGSITYAVNGDSVEIGTNTVYAKMMHYGGTIRAVGGGYLTFKIAGQWAKKREVTIKGRPFLGIDEDGKTEIVDIIERFIGTKLQ